MLQKKVQEVFLSLHNQLYAISCTYLWFMQSGKQILTLSFKK